MSAVVTVPFEDAVYDGAPLAVVLVGYVVTIASVKVLAGRVFVNPDAVVLSEKPALVTSLTGGAVAVATSEVRDETP